MKKTLHVAYRELKTRISTKSYLFTLLISMSIVMATILIPNILDKKINTINIGFTTTVSNQERNDLVWSKAIEIPLSKETKLVRTNYLSDDELKKDISLSKVDIGYSEAKTFVTKKPYDDLPQEIQFFTSGLISNLQQLDAYKSANLSSEQLLKIQQKVPIISESIEQSKVKKDTSRLAASFVGILFTFLIIQTYGSWILMSVIEEKSSRVIEILLAVLKPKQLLTGKVLGLSGAAFINALGVGGVAIATLKAVESPLLKGVTIQGILLSLTWSFAGFIVYAWLYAAAGSLCNRIDEAQNVLLPITIPLILGYFVSISATTGGGSSSLLEVLSFVPFTAPFAAQARYGDGSMPANEQLFALVITFITSAVLAKIASRIYKKSILQTNKKISWKQAIKQAL